MPEIHARYPEELGGLTPWKTVGARLAVEIRNNPNTPFMRAGKGLYGLREWPDVSETFVAPRRIGPLDEDILAVPQAEFLELLSHARSPGLYELHYVRLLAASRTISRREAEESEDFVQLIPSFVIFRDNEILSYKRTKKTPESRLHDTFSVIFGGHLQASDVPSLFSHEPQLVLDFLFRELHEELSLAPPAQKCVYSGVLHLRETRFERQHAGLVFILDAPPHAEVRSLEPGYHAGLRFIPWEEIDQSPIMEDRWSEVCVRSLMKEGL